MSFMDGFLGYNQIKMYPDDKKHTSFRTPFGVYCYTVMPFGLKNAGATYQWAMSKSSAIISEKRWSAMSTTLLSKAAAKMTIFMT